MTATDTIRAMLDERGVEWTANDGEYAKETCWTYMGELTAAFTEYNDGTTRFDCDTWCFTPEQAIEATLGRGECEKLPSDGITRCFVRRYGYEREFGYWKCSACGCECFDGARYCMNCGRKVRA